MRRGWLLAAALCACGAARAQETPQPVPQPVFLPLKGAAPGAFSYARLSDIQVFFDASPTRCAVFLVNGEEIRAFQRCEEITARLSHDGFVSFPSSFGAALLAPGFVTSLIAQSDGSCRLNLRNGRWIPARPPCAAVRETLEGR